MQNEVNQAQDNVIPVKIIEQNQLTNPPEKTFTLPPISGFWRRFFAWAVDTIILGAVGQLIGLLFSSYLYNLGPYGRPIGLLFIIPYFGILNSKIGGGQTLGKRWMKIAVRNNNNEPIELWRSIVRISILTLPAFLNQWQIQLFANIVVSWVLSVIIFGLGGVILYTMVFNRKTRQGIHDLLLGTYVVHLVGKPIQSFPKSSKIHWIVSTIWISATIIGFSVLSIFPQVTNSNTSLTTVKGLYDILQKDPRFFAVGVNDSTTHSSTGNTSRVLIINGWYKGKIGADDREEVAASIIKTVLENLENPSQYDGIQVKISTGFDIGIASADFYSSFFNTIEDWRKEIYFTDAPSGYIPRVLTYLF